MHRNPSYDKNQFTSFSQNFQRQKRQMTPTKRNNQFNFENIEFFNNLPRSEKKGDNINVKWFKLSDFNYNFIIFPNTFKPDHFNQGNTGLCFLFSCLSSIATIPGLIHELFGNNEYWRQQKKFIVFLFHNNERKKIIVNDSFPFDTSKGNCNWIWSLPAGNELFAKIIEKAYLKYQLTYNMNVLYEDDVLPAIRKIIFDGGLEKEAMKILINTKEYKNIYKKNTEIMFKEIKNYIYNKKALITLSRKFNYDSNQGHAYSVIGAWEVNSGKIKKQILCIKNPWESGFNEQENFDLNSLNNSLKGFPELIEFNNKYFDPKDKYSYNIYDGLVGNNLEKSESSIFVAPLDFLIENGLIRIEAHVPDYNSDFPSVKEELDLYDKMDELFKLIQEDNVKNVYDSRVDGKRTITRVLSIGDENTREIISDIYNKNFYKITKNGENYCEIVKGSDGGFNIENMSQEFNEDYMDNIALLTNMKTGQKKIISLDQLLSGPKKDYNGYKLDTFCHKPIIKKETTGNIQKVFLQDTVKQKTFTNFQIITGNPYENNEKNRNNIDNNKIEYSGGYYIGDMLNNKRHGKGKMYYYNRDYEDGTWENDEFIEGECKITFDNGYYKGEYSNRQINGEGKAIYNDGDYQEGIFNNGRFSSGRGKITYDFGYYEGGFSNGIANGYGKMYYNNGDKYIGMFYYGQINGQGKYTYKNGDYEDGQFSFDNFIEGKKKITYSNGVYEGDWKFDNKNGNGMEIINGVKYEGYFVDGKKHGEIWKTENGEGEYVEYEYGKEKSCLIF